MMNDIERIRKTREARSLLRKACSILDRIYSDCSKKLRKRAA